MKELADKIEDSGMSKTEVFNCIDLNGNGSVDKEELLDGLKGLGMQVGFVGRVLSVFDRDGSGEIVLEEWLQLLGEDVEMEEVEIVGESEGVGKGKSGK